MQGWAWKWRFWLCLLLSYGLLLVNGQLCSTGCRGVFCCGGSCWMQGWASRWRSWLGLLHCYGLLLLHSHTLSD